MTILPVDPNPGRVCTIPRRPKTSGLTVRDITRYPDFYIAGPGRALASQTDCGHGYNLTDSCTCCPPH